MTIITMFLLVLAAVLFFLAMLNVLSSPRFNLIGGGLFCVTLAYLVAHVPLR